MEPSSLPNSVDVAIIGGGLAGLTCAVALAERGLRVAVLERERILGGRARSWIDTRTADPVHLGPHILLSAYANMRAFLQRLGTEDRIYWQTDAFIHLVEGTSCYPVKPTAWLPPPLHFIPAVRAAPGLSRRDILSNVPAVWAALRLTEDELRGLEDLTALVWLRRLGVLGVMLALFALTPAIAHQHEPHTPQQQQTEPAPAEAAPGDEPVMTMPWPTAPVMTEHDERPTTFSGRLLRWLGGWHPAAVHFPIALLLTVAPPADRLVRDLSSRRTWAAITATFAGPR